VYKTTAALFIYLFIKNFKYSLLFVSPFSHTHSLSLSKKRIKEWIKMLMLDQWIETKAVKAASNVVLKALEEKTQMN
jgi:hypothetical protein